MKPLYNADGTEHDGDLWNPNYVRCPGYEIPAHVVVRTRLARHYCRPCTFRYLTSRSNGPVIDLILEEWGLDSRRYQRDIRELEREAAAVERELDRERAGL